MVAMHMGNAHMGHVTEAEFIKGCEACGVDSIDKWRGHLPTLRKQLGDKDMQKKMYTFTYAYAEQWEGVKKNVIVEDACGLWPVLLKNKCNFLDKWCAFITKKNTDGKLNIVTKDLWNMLYEFIESCDGKLEAAEDDGCWPVLLEEFCVEQKV